jgi:cytochrome c-type biogenesis protein
MALAAGMVSFLSPCVLPLVPGYLSAVTGLEPDELGSAGWRRVLVPSLLFIASFSAIFILLGLTATELGQTLRDHRATLEMVAGVVIVAMGVLFVAAAVIPRFSREWHPEQLMRRAGTGGPLVVGAAFAIAWTPCVGPTLTGVLSLASLQDEAAYGGLMLAVYAAGLGIPFLLTALAFSRATSAFGWVKRHYGAIIGAGGLILIVMGTLVFTGELFQLNVEAQRLLNDLGINVFSEV